MFSSECFTYRGNVCGERGEFKMSPAQPIPLYNNIKKNHLTELEWLPGLEAKSTILDVHPLLRRHSNPVATARNLKGKQIAVHRKAERTDSEPCDKIAHKGSSVGRLYKTELCRPFEENGICKYGEKCQFAHGRSELRILPRHHKYKTELCRSYHSKGFCNYGSRCHFVHSGGNIRTSLNSVGDSPPSSPPLSESPNSVCYSVFNVSPSYSDVKISLMPSSAFGHQETVDDITIEKLEDLCLTETAVGNFRLPIFNKLCS